MTVEIYTKQVLVNAGDLDIAAYLSQPVAPGSYPGVVVLQEIFGVNIHIREVTERIARLGYVAVALALFQRQAPNFEAGYTEEAIVTGRSYVSQTTAPQLLSDISATINYLKTLDNVKKERFGCIGFCYGGHVAYLAATLSEIAATASFYGAGIATRTIGGGAPTITRTPDIKGTLYAFFGMADASIPVEQVDEIAAELQKYHISHHVFRYDGADHGFFCDHRASYNPLAAIDAWEQVKYLLQTLV
jgi:carboxymethylenebutenolidase